ncbi:hypothetical protein CCMA1212_007328 [Trichoderma ghanense]|uniref:Uncharacterized protein n=1 Tax=Trichoderma ghanense TaxID=65468 RepID=A0ABY2GY60_9HYPO
MPLDGEKRESATSMVRLGFRPAYRDKNRRLRGVVLRLGKKASSNSQTLATCAREKQSMKSELLSSEASAETGLAEAEVIEEGGVL